MDARDAREVFGTGHSEGATGVLQSRVQARRPNLVEAIEECKASAIVNPAGPGANYGFVVVAKYSLEQSARRPRRVGN